MLRDSLSWYIFTFTLLEVLIKTHLTLHDSSHGFISKNPRYFDEDLSNIHEELSSLRTSRVGDVQLHLRFEPSVLDFKKRPLGIPHLEKVTLFNIDKNKSIDMTSISGSTVHFHSSFFEDKKIPPNGNTSFNVVFLGREEGYVESNLFIHTSEGFLKYIVKGASTFSHYRIRPIVGIKVPLNSSFSPLIYMHNPHSEPIQIVEIYSSGGGFHLELPTGEQEGPNDMWEIPPQHTKAVIRVRFQAKVVQNHTAYVRIKLNRPDEILVVPLEIEVLSDSGIMHPQGYIDFGVGGTLDAPKEVKLCLYNPSKKYTRIHSITTTSKAIEVEHLNIRLQPEMESDHMNRRCVDVGTLKVDWKTAYETKDFSGRIIVKYRNGKNKSEIPFYLTVLKGGVTYDPLTTTYFINDKAADLKPREFEVRNDFECPLYVNDIIFPQDSNHYFKIEKYTPTTVRSGEKKVLFNVKFKHNIRLSDMQLQSHILLKTNISDIMVPLLSYNGKLQVHLPFKSKDYSLDIGLISFNTKKEVYFMLVNHNPVTIFLKNVHSSIPMTDVEIHGCGDGDYRLILFQVTFTNLTRCHNIKANQYAVIKVVVETTNVEGQIWGDIFIETQYEHLKVPVHFKIASGKLEIGPDRLVFDQCFPAKICSHPLRVHSTFNDPMIIEDIITLPPDKRISNRHTGHILAKTSKVIGHLFLNPDLECQADCYTGLQTDTSAQWLKTFALTKFVSEFDLHLVNVFYNRYMNLTSNGLKKWQNLTLRLDTSEVRGHIFKTRVKMSWPSLVTDTNSENRSFLYFPLTQVGNVTYQNITVRNPASYSIVIQLVLDRDYPNSDVLINGLPPNLIAKMTKEHTPSNSFFFDNATRNAQLDFFWEMLGIKVSRNTVPIFLKPGQNQSVLIGFHSQDVNIHRALLFLRNNLTILEAVSLRAQGAFPLFKFGNRRPGSLQHLAFDMTGTHLSDCEKRNGKPLSLTVKRTFTARNIGDITVYVNSFFINDIKCEGYGFKVLDCEPFALPPNGTKKIDIAFTPDLTLTRVSRMLILSTSLNEPVNYTLQSSVPPDYLNLCAKLLTRPHWEVYLSWICVFMMLSLLISVMFYATLEAEDITKQALMSFVAVNNQAVQPVLDLRLVGQQVREEIQAAKPDSPPPPIPIVEEKEEEKIVPMECFEVCQVEPKEPEYEELKPKFDADKYTALIPTVGKAKKKLGKRHSGEVAPNSDTDIQITEKIEKKKEKQIEIKNKLKEKREEKELLKMEEREKKQTLLNLQKEKEAKRLITNPNKKPTKNSTSVPVYEEETSSTTTDSSSSSNCDDPDKENQRTSKNCSKLKLSVDKNETIIPVIEENSNNIEVKPVTFIHNHTSHKSKHQKSISKSKSTEKQIKEQDQLQPQHRHEHIPHSKHHVHVREIKRKERQAKERREKGSYHKKNRDKEKQNERQSKISDSDMVEKRKSPTFFNIPLPPVTTSSIWGESRAKFSDVVARSELSVTTMTTSCTSTTTSCPLINSSSSSRPLVHGKAILTNKPTMYVEPYKQTTIELGPIGSRRTEPRSIEINRQIICDNPRFIEDSLPPNNRSSNDLNQRSSLDEVTRGNSNSYFSDDILLDSRDSTSNYLEDLASVGNNWNNQQNFAGLVEPGDQETNASMEDPWNQNLLNTSSYWSSFNPLLLPNNSLMAESTLLNNSPLLSDSPILNEAPLVSESALLADTSLSGLAATQSTAVPSSQRSSSAGYLWGSSSVWQPWTPVESPGTPTRRPPGFGNENPKLNELPHQQNQNHAQESYNPFNSTSLWTQQQNNPWNYSQGQ